MPLNVDLIVTFLQFLIPLTDRGVATFLTTLRDLLVEYSATL